MHYTSVENIMKVIRPLFWMTSTRPSTPQPKPASLNGYSTRLAQSRSTIRCGSGNFLVIAYKELRRLEHRILQRLVNSTPSRVSSISPGSARELLRRRDR